jgi:hypothetical protein
MMPVLHVAAYIPTSADRVLVPVASVVVVRAVVMDTTVVVALHEVVTG